MCGDMNFVRALSALIVGALHLEMIGLRGLPSLCVLTWEKIMGAVQWDGGVQAFAKLSGWPFNIIYWFHHPLPAATHF